MYTFSAAVHVFFPIPRGCIRAPRVHGDRVAVTAYPEFGYGWSRGVHILLRMTQASDRLDFWPDCMSGGALCCTFGAGGGCTQKS